ncbi:tyrosine-type recombinase/integrase [Roseobacter sp. CCS2]|uniref:tyrosine-type recombinase/integrase n=1 Tax=Roseobacter sp. CCS2 TaxID=391593 RepID=UPI0000F40203|nr:site-specific integrase [Roseobacter sp. CCS2]EBA14068.1 putative integrase [Roseobacter sp. CCS2]
MNVELKGIHKVNKILANGSIKTYYYAHRGGPRIQAKYGSPEFVTQYMALKQSASPKVKRNSIDWLITQYLESYDFKALSDASKREYKRYLTLISQKFGKAPIDIATRNDAIAAYRQWHRSMQDKQRTANYALAVLKKLMAWAVDSGNTTTNPTAQIKPIKRKGKSTRRDIIWTKDQINHFNTVAGCHVKNPFNAALLTSQRKKDIIEMTWDAYDGDTIKIRQSKTGKDVWIKVPEELKCILDGLDRTHERVFLNSLGQPWTLDGYDSSFRAAKIAAKVNGVTFHDTRGTAVTLAYIGGASFREISLMSGHSEREVEEIINTHYLNRAAAADAIDAIKKVNQAGKV